MSVNASWDPGINVATCNPYFLSPATSSLFHGVFGGSSPLSPCTCGIYATYNPCDWPRSDSADEPTTSIIGGSIKATGRIIVGTKGFRAEKAEIEALFGPDLDLHSLSWLESYSHGNLGFDYTYRDGRFLIPLKQFADRYRVPWYATREAMLIDFPPHDVSELLKETADVPSEDGV